MSIELLVAVGEMLWIDSPFRPGYPPIMRLQAEAIPSDIVKGYKPGVRLYRGAVMGGIPEIF
jgi:hypothetical protein